MDKAKFSTDMNVMGATFNREITTPMLAGYWQVVKSLSDPEWAMAVAQSLATCRFMPTPADLMQFARPQVAINPDAAIKEIRMGFLRFGRSRTPQWSSAAIEQVVEEAGGWTYLCGIETVQFDRFVVPNMVKKLSLIAVDAVPQIAMCSPQQGT